MRHSKTSRLYATVPKLRVKAKQSQYEESSPFNNVLDDTENVPFFNFNKPEKDLNLTNEKLIDDDELTEESSINDELINNESVNQNKESTDEKTTDEESTDEESLERTKEVSIYILEIML